MVDDQVQLRAAGGRAPGPRHAHERAWKRTSARRRTAMPPSGKPPITRWDYDGFSVYFEHQHVIHAVATAA